MAIQKPTKTKSRKWQWIVLAALVVLVLAYLGGHRAQQAAEKADADRFVALQSDFKKLQVEFNKIDPGWEYSEGCAAKGDVANPENRISCSVALSNPTLSDNKYPALDVVTDSYARHAVELGTADSALKGEYYTYSGSDYYNVVIQRNRLEGGTCEIAAHKTDQTAVSINLTCRSSAQKFYFPKTD